MAERIVTCIEDQLRLDEGERLSAYQDHLGYWTIGVGRLIDDRKGGGISREESTMLLRHDIERVEQSIDKALPWVVTLDPVRRGALVNMGFQMGVRAAGLCANTGVDQAGDYASAADRMLASRWASQTSARARRLADQMRWGGGSRVRNTDQQSSPSVSQALAAGRTHARWPSRRVSGKPSQSFRTESSSSFSFQRRRRLPYAFQWPAECAPFCSIEPVGIFMPVTRRSFSISILPSASHSSRLSCSQMSMIRICSFLLRPAVRGSVYYSMQPAFAGMLKPSQAGMAMFSAAFPLLDESAVAEVHPL